MTEQTQQPEVTQQPDPVIIQLVLNFEQINAVVPDPVLAQSSDPTYCDIAFSNAVTSGPVIKLLDAIVLAIA